ncbi:MAG: glycosyltransferase [Anaerolineae bacterium]|nr:glycosyltransferase [Anaerolineae bacterium]
MAHILVAYKQFPAPNVGHAGGQSIYRLLEALKQRGHRLTLVARIQAQEARHREAVEALCDRVVAVPHHRSLPGPRPFAVARSYAALRRAVLHTIRDTNPDVVHVEFAQTAFVLLGMNHRCTSVRAHDVNWFLMEQQAQHRQGLARLKAQALRALFMHTEPWLLRRFDLIAAISEGDRRLLAPQCAPQPVALLPLAPALEPDNVAAPALPGNANVLFVGAMSRAFNIEAVLWFVDAIWPRVLKAVPEAHFIIAGASPAPEIAALDGRKHITVTGFVEDLGAWYRAAGVFVSPLQVAGGLLQKVLDALGMGVPVVATSVSNHGVSATPGEHLLVADEPEAFAEAVITLLRDPDAREALGAAGRAFVQDYYNPETTMDRWEQTLLSLLDA